MTNNEIDRLCAGTFFTLLSNARYAQPTHAERYAGVFSNITEPYLLYALGRVVTPDLHMPLKTEMRTLKDNVFDLKSCQNYGGKFCGFSSPATLAAFTTRIRTAYSTPLQAMCELVDHFIETNTGTKKDEYLVKALVEVIEQDNIDGDQLFYICENGGTMTKDEICQADTFCLQPFLLGIWHYALTEVNNKEGAATYARWCPSQYGAPRDYTAAIGEKSKRSIHLTYCDWPKTYSDDKFETEDACTWEPAPEEPNIDAEVMEPTQRGQTIHQNIERPIIFNFTQNGNGNTQIGSITNYYAGGKEEQNGQ